jgi:hypothetical protein
MHLLFYPIESTNPSPSIYFAPTPLQDPFNHLLTNLMPTYKQYPWQPQLVPFADQLDDL